MNNLKVNYQTKITQQKHLKKRNKRKKRKLTTKNNKFYSIFDCFKVKNKDYKKCKIEYLKLKKIKLKNKISKILKEKKLTYVEHNNYYLTKKILDIAKTIEPIINKNKNKYRGINNICLIENIAENLSRAILIKEKYNIFKGFEEIACSFKIFKKEAKILNTILISKLIKIYLFLSSDICKIKSEIKKGSTSKTKKITKKQTPSFIYGYYLFNPSSTKALFNSKNLIINSTTKILNELDLICYKQKIIFNYINFLSMSN